MDYQEYVNYSEARPSLNYSKILETEPMIEPMFNYANVKKKKIVTVKKNERCITCKPRGKVKHHIIGKSLCSNYVFHHDMKKRPIILMTPVEHLTSIRSLTSSCPFKAIEEFCEFWNIVDYQLSFNYGSWKTNDHFHIRIKIDNKIAERMRGDHFRKLKFEQNYKE